MANYKFKQTSSGKWSENKNLPFIVTGAVFLLLFFLITVGIIGQKTKEFDGAVAQKIDEIHALIVQEKFREIFLEESRKLVASYSEREFTDLLIQTRPFLKGKIEKSCETIYKDMVNRLKRNLFLSFEMETACQVEAAGLRSVQSFGWQSDGAEIKLIWFDFKPQSR